MLNSDRLYCFAGLVESKQPGSKLWGNCAIRVTMSVANSNKPFFEIVCPGVPRHSDTLPSRFASKKFASGKRINH